MPKTIWVISELYAPDDAATAHLMTQIAEGLAGKTQVAVICAQPTYTARGEKSPVRESKNGVTIYRCWSTTFSKDRLFLRVINIVTIMMSFFVKMIFKFKRGDQVLVVTNPPPLPFLASITARLKGAKTCLLIHDIYPDVLVPTGFTKQGSLPFRLINFFTRRLYRKVNCIITIGRDMRQRVIAKDASLAEKTIVIPNWPDENLQPIQPAQNSLLAELPFKDKFIIQYSGNIGRTHGLNVIADAASLLEERGLTGIHWMICGWGGGKSRFQAQCEALNLDNVSIFEPFPRERLPELICAASVSVISFIPGMSGISVPSRMYNILALGCPIIGVTERDSELAQTIEDDNLGWITPPDDAAGLANLVTEIYRQREELAPIKSRCMTAAADRFSKDKAIAVYRSALDLR